MMEPTEPDLENTGEIAPGDQGVIPPGEAEEDKTVHDEDTDVSS